MAMQAAPLHFPAFEEMPETKRHLKVRTLLFELLEVAFADRAAVGSDQFVYWDATDPRVCLAPDVFLCLGQPNDLFDIWKAWERGVPDLAVEVVSDYDAYESAWEPKLLRYEQLGVRELLRFDPRSASDLRIWDRTGNVLVERSIDEGRQSRVLPGFWCAVDEIGLGATLRLSRDDAGSDLYLTPAERVRELEAELARRGG